MTKEPKNETLQVLLLLALGAAAIYFNTLKAGFFLDDWTVIVSNPAIRNWRDLPTIWNAFNTRFVQGFTLALSYALGKTDPEGYRIFNIAVHASNAALLYFLTQWTFKTPALKDRPLSGCRDLIALFSALLFLVHPVQTTAVNYIWQRAATLATFFYLATVVFYAVARVSGRRRYLALAFVTTVLGMFTKEITATLPVTLAVYELLFFGPASKETKKRILFLLPFLLTLAVIPITFLRSNAVTMELMRPDAVRSVRPAAKDARVGKLDITRWVSEDTMPRKAYYLTQLNVIRTYLRLLVFPVRQNFDYDYPVARHFRDPGVLLSLILLSLLLLSAFGMSRAAPLAAFGIFWFFIGLSVESLVVQNEVIFEHRIYLLTAGFALFLVSSICSMLKSRRAIHLILGLLVLSFSAAAYQRNQVWQDELSLWKDVIKKSPRKASAYNFAGLAYGNQRDFTDAIACYKKAIALKPDFDAAYTNLGTAYAAAGQHEEAIRSYQKAVEIDPNAQSTIGAYNNLGIEYCALEKGAEAETFFKKAVEKAAQIDPHQAEPSINLGMLYSALGRREEARAMLEKAVHLDPANEKARRELAKIPAKTV